MPRVVVAMSGGVDSSVAAAILLEQGYDVIGVTMQIWPEDDPLEEARKGGCCSLAAVTDARRVADILGIPYYVLNLRDTFDREVIRPFIDAYVEGRTPNPCILCNRMIKFDALLQKARELEADYLATGHYARTWHDAGRGRHLLARARDRGKDQSYVLYTLTQEQLSGLLLPLGDLVKDEVRRAAAQLGLPVATKPESQEICFVEPGGCGRFVARRTPERVRPGPILDTRGRVIGRHRGLPYYTIGQRRGLGIAAPRPLYVVEIDAARNAVIVGYAEESARPGMEVGDVNFILLENLADEMEAEVQIRYHSQPQPATLTPSPQGVAVRFLAPQRGITPGQAAVFYLGDLVLGGGTITRVFEIRP